jgi:hypothetical protein
MSQYPYIHPRNGAIESLYSFLLARVLPGLDRMRAADARAEGSVRVQKSLNFQ